MKNYLVVYKRFGGAYQPTELNRVFQYEELPQIKEGKLKGYLDVHTLENNLAEEFSEYGNRVTCTILNIVELPRLVIYNN